MRWWLTARDGSINCQVEAPDAPQAFEVMAKQLRYSSFAALSADLGYSPGDFRLATIQFETAPEYDPAAGRKRIEQQQADTLLGAFKSIRRLTR